MKLKSFGCSFIFGNDLHDDGRHGPWATASKHTWPALLAKKLGYKYECFARAGSGNLRILEKVLIQAAYPDPALFVIGWSWIERFDYTDTKDEWNSIMPIDTDDVAKVYYRDLHSQYRDKLTTLIHIKTAIDVLKSKNYPFIMTSMDDLLWERHWHSNPAIIELQDYVRPYFSDFEGMTFLDWSREKGFVISDMLHPLEEAHQAAADLVSATLEDRINY